jgi:hypothetical protein
MLTGRFGRDAEIGSELVCHDLDVVIESRLRPRVGTRVLADAVDL